MKFSLTIFITHAVFHCVSAHISLPNYSKTVVSVQKCLQSIIYQEFDINPKGFAVITKAFDLAEPAHEVLNNFLRAVFGSERIGVMTVGNDLEDVKTRLTVSLNQSKGSEHEKADELGFDKTEDILVQSHLMYIRLSDFYVIIVDGYRMCKSKIRQLRRIPSWNARALMIIYCSKRVTSEREMIRYPTFILRFLWDFNVMNVVFLIHDWRNNSIVNIYSWEPYDPPDRCGEKDPSNMESLVQKYDTCEGGELVSNRKLFPNKVPQNLKGCPIDFLGVIWHPFLNHNTSESDAGLDKDLIDIIAEKLNFTINLNTEQTYWGDRDDFGLWDGMMGDLKKGKGDVAIGAIYPDNDVHEDFDSTLSYLQDSYVWVVPRARRIPEWENLIITLTPLVWLASLCILCIVIVFWFLFSKPKSETGIHIKSFMPAFLDCWCMYIGASIVSRPNGNSFRIYFVFFCLYSMIWCTCYQAKLINVLTSPAYEHQIKYTSELLKSKLKLGGNEAFKFLFNNSIDEMEDYLHSNYLNLDIHEVLDDVITYRNVSVLTSKLYVRYLSATTTHYNDMHGAPLYYTLHSKAFSFPVEMVTIKGFAFLDRFNTIITLLKSSGLVKHFFHNFNEMSDRKAAKLIREAGIHEEEQQILNLEHLQGAFFILLIGTIFSTIAFFVELLFYKQRKIINEYFNISCKRLQQLKICNLFKKQGKNEGLSLRVKKNLHFYIPKKEYIKWTLRYYNQTKDYKQ